MFLWSLLMFWWFIKGNFLKLFSVEIQGRQIVGAQKQTYNGVMTEPTLDHNSTT